LIVNLAYSFEEKDSMRILVNARFLLPNKLEGIGFYTLEIIKRISLAHPDHQFILCVDRKSSMSFQFSENVSYELIRPMARHPFLFIWWFEVGIPRAYQKVKADLFFSPDGFLSLSKKVRKSLVVIHDLAYLHYPDQVSSLVLWYYQKYMPKFIEKADQIITVSKSTALDIIDHFPAAEPNIQVVYNGVREGCKAALRPEKLKGPGTNKPYFIAIGSIHPRKNIIGLLKAFEKMRGQFAEEVNLVIIGRKAWKTRSIQSIYDFHKFKSDIYFTGYLSDEDMFEYITKSVGLVYVSFFEGFGLPVIEAMAMGTPVITSERSSMKEIAGDAALLVDPDNPDDIAEGMLTLLKNEARSQSLRGLGLERAKLFDWDRAAKDVWSIMKAMTLRKA
jgi:glycosyltransferase involved in cell wall biosynthesis